jgi:hypothetical protein
MNVMDDTDSQPTSPPKSRRRWFRFSLRTMMVAVTLLCIWLGITAHRANRQRSAVQTIASTGGHVWYDYEVYDDGIRRIDRKSPPDWLKNLIGVDYFAAVYSVDWGPNDDTVAALVDLPELRDVQLVGPDVTNSVLAKVKGMRELHRLSLVASSETDVGWKALGQFPQLKRLLLCADRQVTDATLEYIRDFRNLEWLFLDDDRITDAGLQRLAVLTRLEYLDIRGTKTSAAGVEDLKRVLPNLTVLGP